MMNQLRDNKNILNHSFRNFYDNNEKRHQKEDSDIGNKMADCDH